jgi:phenylacetic acid degradation operon negative regulatory protein
LGSHPPVLPGRLLVAMGERFGISGGTIRVALSRMVERGELTNDDGEYALAGELLERQERQDRSRTTTELRAWDGSWEQAVVTTSGRSASERAKLRQALTSLGTGELREGVWMRPANLAPDRLPSARTFTEDQVVWYRIAPLDHAAAAALAASLYDLDTWAGTATALHLAICDARRRLDGDDDAVVFGFNLASATLRHLVHDPQLPPELAPPCWPAETLRRSYAELEVDYKQLLRRFFRSIG